MPSKKEVSTFTFDGRRYYVRGDTKEQAKILAELKKKEMEDGRLFRESSMTVSQWFEEYLDTYKTNVAEKTRKDYQGIYDKAIRPQIGHFPLKAVKPIHCQQVMNSLQGKSYSYVHKVDILLKGIFASAVDNELINKNPSIRATKPTAVDGKRRALTEDERTGFIKASYEVGEAGLFCRIIYYCGLRPSEVNRIQGGDYTDTLLKVRGTKTAAAERTVPIPSALALPKLKKGQLLFTNTQGEMRDKDGQRRYWTKIVHKLDEMGVPHDGLTMYCLRHDYCTRLQEAGVPIDVARRLMGHSSIEVTSRIYTHDSESVLYDALALIENHSVAPGVAPSSDNVGNTASTY